MPKYRSHGQLDDPHVEDGDSAFIGLDQETEPTLLKQGMVQIAENVRFEEGVIKSRKGLTLLKEVENTGKALVRFLDPNNLREDMVIVTTKGISSYLSGSVLINPWDTNEDIFDEAEYVWADYNEIDSDFDDPLGESDFVNGTHCFDKIIIFSNDSRPRIWNGNPDLPVENLSTRPADESVDFACPDAAFGMYFANRLVVPYRDDSPTTVAFSDILELNQFTNLNTFFCNKGTSDKTVGFAPFSENQVLVLNKHSLHLINNCHALASASTNYEVSRQYGCAGSRAFAQNGSYTYFVSNEGSIQVLVPSSDPAKGLGISISKITLDQEPLSKPITPFIETVNLEHVDKSLVHYHRNKVYFCLPVNGSTEPNAICVYDSLNSQWVSIDTFEDPNFKIVDINSLNETLFILTADKFYSYETNTSDDGELIKSKVRTRDFLMGTREIKKFARGTLNYILGDDAELSVKTYTKNPDSILQSRIQTSFKTTEPVLYDSLKILEDFDIFLKNEIWHVDTLSDSQMTVSNAKPSDFIAANLDSTSDIYASNIIRIISEVVVYHETTDELLTLPKDTFYIVSGTDPFKIEYGSENYLGLGTINRGTIFEKVDLTTVDLPERSLTLNYIFDQSQRGTNWQLFASILGSTNFARFSARNRGHSASIEVSNNSSSIDIKGVSIEGFIHAGKALGNYNT